MKTFISINLLNRKSLILLFIVFLINSCFSQIPNPSFENWTGNQPDGWHSFNNPPVSPYIIDAYTTTAVTGTYAYKSITYPAWGTYTVLASGIVTGNSSTNYYLPISSKPNSLNGMYFINTWHDSLCISVWLKSNGSVIGTGKDYKKGINGFNAFITNITYSSIAIPDSFKIDISFNHPGGGWVIYSNCCGQGIHNQFYIIDDLFFDYNPVNIKEPKKNESVIKVFPNPACNTLNFQVYDDANNPYNINIFDSYGNIIKSKSENSKFCFIDIDNFISGFYFYSISFKNGERKFGTFVKQL